VLGQNQYGKAETRVVRVRRDDSVGVHHITDVNVSVALSGDLAATHLTGDNTGVLPTDTMKNTCYVYAKQVGLEPIEAYALALAEHFVTTNPTTDHARVRVEQYAWDRLAPHSFARAGGEVRTTEVTFDGGHPQTVSGLRDLVVMNTTDSEFRGFRKDQYTTLPEADDRILATAVHARWRYGTGGPGHDWSARYAEVRGHLLDAFAGTYSRSLQQTLYAMGERVLTKVPTIDEIRLSLPNRHHFLVDLARFDIENENEVFIAADRPYGLIEATLVRDGAEQLLPVE
jgi:urate oxidase